MPRLSDRKRRELRAQELRVILDPAGQAAYKAELSRLEQWLALDDELAAGTAPARKRGRPPKSRTTGSQDPVAPPKRKRGRPRKITT